MPSVIQNWAIFLVLIGAGYIYFTVGKKGEARGRPLQRGANNATANVKAAAQWSDEDSKSKSKPAGKANKKAPRKSVKKAVQEVGDKAEAYLSAASSNTGAEADDDTSPTVSPKVNPSGRDVSDMLEPQGPKSVLKINASDKPARPSKPQQQRTESATESKKQRQNRKKKEEEKAAREAAEEERKKLLEQQRRTAREARGESARNGLQAAQAPASNAWSNGSAPAAKPTLIGSQLLDTLDNVSEVTPSQGGVTNGTTKYTNLPSEEDQLRMAMEESAWTTVPKGGRKKTKKEAEEGSDSGAPEATQAPVPVKAAPVKAAPTKKVENTKPAARFDVLSQQTTDVGDPRDSDWPVV